MSIQPDEYLHAVLDAAPDGIAICEAQGEPRILYANAMLTQLSGYSSAELLGASLKLLVGAEPEHEVFAKLSEALARAEPHRFLLRGRRKDGTPLWAEVVAQPLPDAQGRGSHFAAYLRDASERLKTSERGGPGLPAWVREDRASGLATREYFEELLARDWKIAQREMRGLTLTIYDIDNLGAYNEAFGRIGADACIRRVARLVASSHRRGSDVVGRWDGGGIAVLTHGAAPDAAAEFARGVAQRVHEQRIHHPRSPTRYVTVSAGVAALIPVRDQAVAVLVGAALAALARAKAAGRNCVMVAEPADLG